MLARVRSRGVPYVVFTNGTNRSPAHTGKPSLPALRAAADRLGVARLRDLAVVGDDPLWRCRWRTAGALSPSPSTRASAVRRPTTTSSLGLA
jgi:ribonucleotide monophosphatase NagD (HAD superfamily)